MCLATFYPDFTGLTNPFELSFFHLGGGVQEGGRAKWKVIVKTTAATCPNMMSHIDNNINDLILSRYRFSFSWTVIKTAY